MATVGRCRVGSGLGKWRWSLAHGPKPRLIARLSSWTPTWPRQRASTYEPCPGRRRHLQEKVSGLGPLHVGYFYSQYVLGPRLLAAALRAAPVPVACLARSPWATQPRPGQPSSGSRRTAAVTHMPPAACCVVNVN